MRRVAVNVQSLTLPREHHEQQRGERSNAATRTHPARKARLSHRLTTQPLGPASSAASTECTRSLSPSLCARIVQRRPKHCEQRERDERTYTKVEQCEEQQPNGAQRSPTHTHTHTSSLTRALPTLPSTSSRSLSVRISPVYAALRRYIYELGLYYQLPRVQDWNHNYYALASWSPWRRRRQFNH